MSKRRKKGRKNGQIPGPLVTPAHHGPSKSYSGLDPMYTVNSASYMEGAFLKRVFTGRLRTRNPFYLTLMGVGGIVTILPALCAGIELVNSASRKSEIIEGVDENGVIFVQINNPPDISGGMLFLFGLMALLGIALLVNLVINLRRAYRLK